MNFDLKVISSVVVIFNPDFSVRGTNWQRCSMMVLANQKSITFSFTMTSWYFSTNSSLLLAGSVTKAREPTHPIEVFQIWSKISVDHLRTPNGLARQTHLIRLLTFQDLQHGAGKIVHQPPCPQTSSGPREPSSNHWNFVFRNILSNTTQSPDLY